MSHMKHSGISGCFDTGIGLLYLLFRAQYVCGSINRPNAVITNTFIHTFTRITIQRIIRIHIKAIMHTVRNKIHNQFNHECHGKLNLASNSNFLCSTRTYRMFIIIYVLINLAVK